MSDYNKYLKYKQKYLQLKNQIGGLAQLKINITDGVIKPIENGSLNNLEDGSYYLERIIDPTNLYNVTIKSGEILSITNYGSDIMSLSKSEIFELKNIKNGDYIIRKKNNDDIRYEALVKAELAKDGLLKK